MKTESLANESEITTANDLQTMHEALMEFLYDFETSIEDANE